MIKSLKTLIFVGLASLLLVACGQGGGGAGSKKSKTLDNTKKAGFEVLNSFQFYFLLILIIFWQVLDF